MYDEQRVTKTERAAFFETLTPEQRLAVYELLKEAAEQHARAVMADLTETCRRQEILLISGLGTELLTAPVTVASSGDRPH